MFTRSTQNHMYATTTAGAMLLVVLGSLALRTHLAMAQFLTDFEVAETKCYSVSDRDGGPYPLYSANYLIDEYTHVPALVATFVGNDKRAYELNCFYVVDTPPLDVPTHLSETCASNGNMLYLAQEITGPNGVKSYPIEANVNYFDTQPASQLVFGGRNEKPVKTRGMLWAPAKSYTSPACYPRYVTVVYSGGLVPEKSNPVIAYVVIGVIAGVMGIVAIGVFAYLLHRRMNTFMLRGEKLGAQKYTTDAERYGPGDEDPEAVKAQERARHLKEMAQYAPQYATAEVEIEKGVFVPRRIDLYRDEDGEEMMQQQQGHRELPPEHYAHEHDAFDDIRYQANRGEGASTSIGYDGLNDDVAVSSPRPDRYPSYSRAYSPASPYRGGVDNGGQFEVPPTVRGLPSTRLYGDQLEAAVPVAGPRSAVIEVPLAKNNLGGGEAVGSDLGPATVPVHIVSVPLRRPWYEQLTSGSGHGTAPVPVVSGVGGGPAVSPSRHEGFQRQAYPRRSGSEMLRANNHAPRSSPHQYYDGPPDRI